MVIQDVFPSSLFKPVIPHGHFLQFKRKRNLGYQVLHDLCITKHCLYNKPLNLIDSHSYSFFLFVFRVSRKKLIAQTWGDLCSLLHSASDITSHPLGTQVWSKKITTQYWNSFFPKPFTSANSSQNTKLFDVLMLQYISYGMSWGLGKQPQLHSAQ